MELAVFHVNVTKWQQVTSNAKEYQQRPVIWPLAAIRS